MFLVKTKLLVIWFNLKWLFCNKNIYMYVCMYVCMNVSIYVILNNQYYIWWFCKKWKKLNSECFGNIILIRKGRTIIFLRIAYKLSLWIV